MAASSLLEALGFALKRNFRAELSPSGRDVYFRSALQQDNVTEISIRCNVFVPAAIRAIRERKFVRVLSQKRKVVVEFGSPNIAKPFHPGNFRSALLGNSISKILALHGDEVHRFNYLGDWGDQFNLLLTQCMLSNDDPHQFLSHVSVDELLKIYADANVLYKEDENFRKRCRETKIAMESGSEEHLKTWRLICERTTEYCEQINEKFRIEYDYMVGESQFTEEARKLSLKLMDVFPAAKSEDGYLLSADRYRIKIPYYSENGENKLFSTYLTRDLAALFDRKEVVRELSHVFYIVDKGQFEHFRKLKLLHDKLEPESTFEIVHTQFGRVIGMSSRRNRILSMDSLLQDATDLVIQQLSQLSTTKSSPETFLSVAEQIAAASLAVNCFSYKRTSDYRFNWGNVVSFKGKSALYMLMTCAKVRSIFRTLGVDLDEDSLQFHEDVLFSEEKSQITSLIVDLMVELFNYESVLLECYETLDLFKLTDYLYHVCKRVTRLHGVAHCLNEVCVKKQSNRLLAFRSALLVIEHGLKVIGVTPLDKI